MDFKGLKLFSLTGSVGNMMQNDDEDVTHVKNALFASGHRKDPAQNGVIDQETDDAIRSFQREKGLKVDGILKPGGETEEALRKETVDRIEQSQPKWYAALEANISDQRRDSILKNTPARFVIKDNPDADGRKPIYELPFESDVGKYDRLMHDKAQKHNVDPDLVRAIAHMETTHGKYDLPFSWLDKNKSILPMNINAKYWEGLGYTREDLKDPEKNIDAGAKLLKAIIDRVPNASVRSVATLYQNLAADKVSDYGARVDRIYKEKLWEKQKK